MEEAFTEGRDERGWVEWVLDRYRETRFPDLPPLDDLLEKNVGVWAKPVTRPAVAFEDFRRDPVGHPLDTPSGKIEIFSKALLEKGRPDEIPAVPKYVEEWESPFGPEATAYPLQVIGHHTLHRVHSTHDNNDWLEEAFPQRVFLNPLDAGERGIADGDEVRVFNAPRRRGPPVPRHAADPAGRDRPPAGGVVDARRARRGPPRQRERPDERALDAARVRHRAAHRDGAGGTGGEGERETGTDPAAPPGGRGVPQR